MLKTFSLIFVLAGLALAQDAKPVPAKPPVAEKAKPTPLTADERLELMKVQRQAILDDNTLKQLIASYNDTKDKAKASLDKWTEALKEATAKAGCPLDNDFKCQPAAPAK